MKNLRIGDFANVVGISVKTIRFYEEKRLLKPAYIDKYTGYRYYDENVIGKWKLLNDEPFPLNELYFLHNGKEYWVFSWTKGYLKVNDALHPYEIENDILVLSIVDVNGVISKKVKFRRINNKKYTIDKIKQVDDVGYEFVNDENVLGIWKTIAFTYSNDITKVIKDKQDDLF